MNPWHRAALVAVAAGAFWLQRSEAECGVMSYYVQMKLAATTPQDDSWPATVELTQVDDTTITWTAPAQPVVSRENVSLVAQLR